MINSLYDGEEFTLQLDSHHRFERGWDRTLRNLFNLVNSPKPIFSSYPAPYQLTPDGRSEFSSIPPQKLVALGFADDHTIHQQQVSIENHAGRTTPYRARFLAAGFLFTLGKFCEECRYDPQIYFKGEETTLAARAYTLGYDLYHPHENTIYHLYTRKNHPKHWDDHVDWTGLNEIAQERIKAVLVRNEVATPFGLGTKRTLREYELYAGVNFGKKLLHKDTLGGLEPPTTRDKSWETSPGTTSSKSFRFKLDLSRLWTWIPQEYEYQFWFLGMHDRNSRELIRRDLTETEYIFRKRRDVVLEFTSQTEPVTVTLWPYRKEGGWTPEKITVNISEAE
jgi:hypothetical protein